MADPIIIDAREVNALQDRRLASPQMLERGMFMLLCLLLVFGPLAFGAVEPWSIALLETGAALLMTMWVVLHLTVYRELPHNVLFPPMAAFAAVVLLQLLMRRTAYPYATRIEAMKYLAYAFVFCAALTCLNRREYLKRFAILITVFGVLLACFAIVQDFAGNGKIYWVRRPRDLGWTFGPYVDHDHYAGLMEMLAPFPLAWSLVEHMPRTRQLVLSLAGVVMAATIFLSGSRAGMVAFGVQLLVMAFIVARHRGLSRAGWKMAGVGGLLLILLLVIGIAPVLQRLESLQHPLEEYTLGSRLAIARDLMVMFAQRPILGWGLGTFPWVYPQYRSFYTNLLIDHAHNDYLQLLAETGLAGFAAVAWFVAMLYRTGWRKLHRWSSGATGAFKVAALMGCTGIVVHSLADFNLQIPANAAYFYTLCAIVTGSLREDKSRAEESS